MDTIQEGKYRPKHPDSPFVHVADLVGEDGLTDRERNERLGHNIALGTFVEVSETMERLYVRRLGRDCDGTPLYWLGMHDDEDESEDGERFSRLRGGYSEDSLTVLPTPTGAPE